jgi:signal transduction histidine kinase
MWKDDDTVEPRDRTRENPDGQGEHSSREVFEHYIRTPLTVIYGQVQLMQRRLDKGQVLSPDDLRRTLQYIEGAARSIEAHLSARTEQVRRKRHRADGQ